jgi:hypothetical protein
MLARGCIGRRAADHRAADHRYVPFGVRTEYAGRGSVAFEYHDLMLGFPYHHPHPTSPSPAIRGSNLLINSALCVSAAFMAVIVCFKVLVFDPQTTVPPITAASAPIMTVASNPTAPMLTAKIKAPPAAMAAFETRMNFLQLSITSASSSMWASICKTCSRRSPSSPM